MTAARSSRLPFGGAAALHRRLNGLQRPYDLHQITSWIAYALLLAAFFGLFTPVHSDLLGVVLTVMYSLLAVLVFLSGGKCMRIDPKDRGVAAEAGQTSVAQHFCYYCEKQVNHRSKHCRRCNKCVETFDHHCPWLNSIAAATRTLVFPRAFDRPTFWPLPRVRQPASESTTTTPS